MRRQPLLLATVAVLLLASSSTLAQSAMLLSNVRKIYIEKMADNLDQYLASSISGKFHGAVAVVLNRKDADAIMRGVNIGAQTTSNATVELVDPGEHQVLWSDTVSDRKMLTLGIAHGGQQKMADSLIGELKKAMRR
jgi:hypothetical protein